MKVIDILTNGATMLGLVETAITMQNSQKTDAEKLADADVGELFRLFNLSIQELCTSYMPILCSSKIETNNKTYPVASLNNCIRVNMVKCNDKEVKFKIINRVINFETDGTYDVEFSSYPTFSSLNDDVSFLQQYGVDVAVFGLCAYYCLTKGMFEDFERFHNAYLEKGNALKDMKIFVMPQRRWE